MLHVLHTGASSSCSEQLQQASVAIGARGERRTREIKRDAKRRAELVVAGIAFSNRRVGIIHPGKDAGFAQFCGCSE